MLYALIFLQAELASNYLWALEGQHSQPKQQYNPDYINKRSDVDKQSSRPKQEDVVYAKQMSRQLEDFHQVAKNLDFLIEKLPETGKGCGNRG